MKDDSRKLTSKIIEFTVEFPDVEIAERLQVEQSAPVYKIIRLRLLDGKPYALEHTYMACDLVPGLDDSICWHRFMIIFGTLCILICWILSSYYC